MKAVVTVENYVAEKSLGEITKGDFPILDQVGAHILGLFAKVLLGHVHELDPCLFFFAFFKFLLNFSSIGGLH